MKKYPKTIRFTFYLTFVFLILELLIVLYLNIVKGTQSEVSLPIVLMFGVSVLIIIFYDINQMFIKLEKRIKDLEDKK